MDDFGPGARPSGLPRPAGLPLWPNATSLIQDRGNTASSDPSHATMVGSHPRYRKASTWIKRFTLHAKTSTIRVLHTWMHPPLSRDNVGGTEGREASRPGRSAWTRPAGPLTVTTDAASTVTDTRTRSAPSRRKAVTRGVSPRPAGLGGAGRPPSAASRLQLLRTGASVHANHRYGGCGSKPTCQDYK